MKHIKPFNESVDNLVEELKDFCETSLAYLIDDGFNISLQLRDKVKYPEKQHIIMTLGMPSNSSRFTLFSWNKVKDHFIPFLQMLVKRYELILDPVQSSTNGYIGFNTEIAMRYLSLDQVINDRVNQDFGCRIWNITIRIIDKI